MRVFYFTTVNPALQGDLQEVCTLIGLRLLLGDRCIDYPRKKVMYGDFSESPKNQLHGRGFTLYKLPLPDFPRDLPEYSIDTINKEDILIYGTTNAYDNPRYKDLESKAGAVFFIDGHDDDLIYELPCFKRECHITHPDVYPFGFSIPEYQIRPINFSIKDQLYQKTAPLACFSDDPRLLASGLNYIFTDENEYYNDMSRSWFGLTCRKGGWDCLRHYEIMAAGSLLLFKNYDKKSMFYAPQHLPCLSFSNFEEAKKIMDRLVINNKPTSEYIHLLTKQRRWLIQNGTCTARATYLMDLIFDNLDKIKMQNFNLIENEDYLS